MGCGYHGMSHYEAECFECDSGYRADQTPGSLFSALAALPPGADFDDIGDCLGENYSLWPLPFEGTYAEPGCQVSLVVKLGKDMRGDSCWVATATVTRTGLEPVTGTAWSTYC